MNYDALSLELKVERLLRSCAILPILKGFYPLRDLILLYHSGEVTPDAPRKAAATLNPRYGRRCRDAMHRALLHSWRRPECRLSEYIGRGPLDKPPGVEEFAHAICRKINEPACVEVIRNAQAAFSGAAEIMCLQDEEDIQILVDEVRQLSPNSSPARG